MKPFLQLALDFTNIVDAIRVCRDAIEGGIDWIEVGTPLIKSEGIKAVSIFKKLYPDKTIVADMKVADVGWMEVEMAAKAGADIVTVLGSASNSTIQEAVKAAKHYGIKIMADLIGEEEIVERSKELEKLGVHYICIHAGIDEWRRGVNVIQILKKVVGKVNVPLAVAGGINSESAKEAVKLGAEVIIVGSAITKSTSPRDSAAEIKKAICSTL